MVMSLYNEILHFFWCSFAVLLVLLWFCFAQALVRDWTAFGSKPAGGPRHQLRCELLLEVGERLGKREVKHLYDPGWRKEYQHYRILSTDSIFF